MYVPFSFYSRSDPAQILQPTLLPRHHLNPQCRGPSCAIVKVLQSFCESLVPSAGFSAKFLSKNTEFWSVTSCRLVEFYRRLGRTYCHHRRVSPAGRKQQHHSYTLTIEVLRSSETSVNVYQSTRHHIPEKLPSYVTVVRVFKYHMKFLLMKKRTVKGTLQGPEENQVL